MKRSYYINPDNELWRYEHGDWYVWCPEEDEDYPWHPMDYGENYLGDLHKLGINYNKLKKITDAEAFLIML